MRGDEGRREQGLDARRRLGVVAGHGLGVRGRSRGSVRSGQERLVFEPVAGCEGGEGGLVRPARLQHLTQREEQAGADLGLDA